MSQHPLSFVSRVIQAKYLTPSVPIDRQVIMRLFHFYLVSATALAAPILQNSQLSEASRHTVRADEGLLNCMLHEDNTDPIRCAKARSLQSEAGVDAVIVRRDAMPVRFTPENNFEEQDPRNQRRQPQGPVPMPCNLFSCGILPRGVKDLFNLQQFRESAPSIVRSGKRSISNLLSRIPSPASVCSQPSTNLGYVLLCAGRTKTPATAAEIETALDAVDKRAVAREASNEPREPTLKAAATTEPVRRDLKELLSDGCLRNPLRCVG
ncbi:uncharacterized protein AB675_703 [Cyphellophora attinorum]|uniref:Uncharacterized protein n=1 Tax=Cyphellophora attinorum TaxID=1664694 RepID=A0A0N1HHT2_9EURO|nr:uncharacterized protein AB675_703 [Phialophora attinorum]KPI45675.1 hypothetical protein AB675_703 [Phialophora attinorum]